MARIAGVDLPRNKRIEIGLTYIYGIGRTSSRRILQKLDIDLDLKTDNLTEDQIVGKYNVLQDHNLNEQGVMPQVSLASSLVSVLVCG